ncbi:MAG: DUF2723 domain-containing protein [Bacteroidales bacterium]|nr:DUF2723 domain-containing protein [Bacteroidales bacterium]
MENFRRYNLILGWGVFLVSLIVYLLTMEPTASFWDCGEFIATAYKMEVGHPPGAPFFMILGRFFTLFAGGDVTRVAVSMNILSAMASAFTILFLFWTLTHLVRKFFEKEEQSGPVARITVFGAALVGSLAYTFSDSFWFSAVEAEVYSTSSLFTAVVFWAILKWENVADEPGANRWLILIAYLMGLSIGVHLLNLLAIPAIIMVYYFRKYTPTAKGVLAAMAVSVGILGVINYMLIPGLTAIAGKFELLFVNGLGLPFNSGVVVYVLLLFSGLIAGIYLTHKKGKVLWNTVLLGLFVIVIGYSSYAIIVIRSAANTPLDESNPDTVFSLLDYLNRDQYGDNPLVYGAYFNHRPTSIKESKPSYYKGEDKYFQVDKNREYVYDKSAKGVFPRMWSTQDRHANEYIYWGGMSEADLYDVQRDAEGNPMMNQFGTYSYDRNRAIGRPSFGQNMRFFFRYQVGYMYLRYFMWNFAGRQNDIQGHGELTKGNWISGIKFIDQARLGPQENLPSYIVDNKGNNKYYLLPLLLGLAGAFFHYKKHQKDFWVVGLLFVLTGFAILVYLNQYPIQPRERDYAYAASFYAFAIWIGIGVAGLIEWASGKKRSAVSAAALVLASLILVPGIMAKENWDDHDRSDRYTAPAFARNFLNSCLPGGIMFTNGDNDTFPLWYLQEVEGVRTDVRVVNLSYLTADWYIEQMKQTFYDTEALPIAMTREQYVQGERDFAYLVDNAGVLIKEKYEANRESYEEKTMGIYSDLLEVLEGSLLQQNHANDYKAIEALENNMDPLRLYSYMRTFNSEEIASRIQLDKGEMNALTARMESMIRRIDADYAPLKEAFAFMLGDDPRFQQGQYFIPAKKFVIPADSASLAPWVVPEKFRENQVDQVRFSISDQVLYKNLLTVMDLLGTNDWERPIYFSTTVPSDNYLNLDPYFVREGLALRVAPVEFGNLNYLGKVDTDDMYRKLMEEFDWGGLDTPGIYMDENNLRMTIHYRYAFSVLAGALTDEGRPDEAKEVLDRCMQRMPEENVPYNAGITPIIQGYFGVGDTATANRMVEKYEQKLESELDYYVLLSMKNKYRFAKTGNDFLAAVRDINQLRSMCLGYGEIEASRRLEEKLSRYGQEYDRLFR